MALLVSVVLVVVDDEGWAEAAAPVVEPKLPPDWRDSPARLSDVTVPAPSLTGLVKRSGSEVT